ncbi:MAG: NAD(+) diphosphatase [Pseudomonadota bacterium]
MGYTRVQKDFDKLVTFGSSDLDRNGLVRENAEDLDRLWSDPNREVLFFWRGKVLVNSAETDLQRTKPGHALVPDDRENAIYLGQDNGSPVWAISIRDWPGFDKTTLSKAFFDPSTMAHPDIDDGGFVELRKVMILLSRRDAELAASARSLFEYHRTHMFCARCGGATRMSKGGWQRVCLECERPHHPRTDPVVIMLVTDGNRLLLGRSPGWPEGMFSLLAGFVEPGETVENAVRREVMEEAGIEIGPVRYIGSQPWPFPASLMFGCQAKALTTEITLDPNELEDAKWVAKDELLADLADGDSSLKAARKGAIAQHLIRDWVAGYYDGTLPWN